MGRCSNTLDERSCVVDPPIGLTKLADAQREASIAREKAVEEQMHTQEAINREKRIKKELTIESDSDPRVQGV